MASHDISRSKSAVFISPAETHHADRCEPLEAAVRRGEVRLAAFARRGYPGQLLPTDVLPEVSTIGFWDAVGTQTWGLEWHRNEGIELTYLSRGKTAFLVDNEDFTLENGFMTITRPWQRHRVGNPHVGPSRLCWLILDVGVRRPDQVWKWPDWLILSPHDLDRLTTLLSHNEQPVWRANDEIGACFEKLASLVQSADPASSQTRLRLYINELFVALRELLETREVKLNSHLATSRRTVEMFLNALPDHLDQQWTLPEMARQCGLGSSAFSDYCRQVTNMTPARYLAHSRVARARKLLLETPSMSITDIALECGFQTSQYFATVFRQHTGKNPRQFREKP